ncbi:MAG: ABC transporter permease [Propioniciclava sp.]
MGQVDTRDGRGPVGRLKAIWRHRDTLWLLVRRDLKVRYADSLLGYVWSVLDPLIMSLIYFFVFTYIFHRSVGGEPYIIFLLLALLPWLWFNTGTMEGMKALKTQARLVRSTAVPREIWVLRSVIAKGIEFGLSIPVLVLFMVGFHSQMDVNGNVWLFPVAIVMQMMLISGAGLLLAPLMVLLKDIEPLVRLSMRFLFYASPVIYGVHDVVSSVLPPAIQWLYMLNPMTGILSAYRAGFFATELDWLAILIAAFLSLGLLIVGWWVFARTEKTVLKEM